MERRKILIWLFWTLVGCKSWMIACWFDNKFFEIITMACVGEFTKAKQHSDLWTLHGHFLRNPICIRRKLYEVEFDSFAWWISRSTSAFLTDVRLLVSQIITSLPCSLQINLIGMIWLNLDVPFHIELYLPSPRTKRLKLVQLLSFLIAHGNFSTRSYPWQLISTKRHSSWLNYNQLLVISVEVTEGKQNCICC